MPEPTLGIQVVTNAADAVADLGATSTAIDGLTTAARDASGKVDSASAAIRNLGDDADTGATNVRNAGDALDSIGGTASGVTTGLRDMADAVEMVGFPGLSAAMTTAAVGFEAIDGATTLYSATSGALSKVLGGVSKAFNFLKVTILSNPIFWIAAIIIAIVAAFILLYKRCEGFRKIVDAVFKFAWNLIKGFWNWIKSAFTLLIAILRKPFDIWWGVVTRVIGIIRGIIAGLIDWIRGAIQAISAAWKSVFNAVVGIVKSAIGKVTGIIRGIIDTVTNIVNSVKDAFSGVFDAITAPFRKAMDWVRNTFKLPDLNPFSAGAPEAAAFGRGLSVAPRSGATRATATGGNVVININGPISTHDTVRELRRLLREDQSRLGRAALRPVLA